MLMRSFLTAPESVSRTENYSVTGIGDFSMKIGGTVYDVSTHFSTDGKQSVLQQFRDLLLSQKLL